MNAASSKYKTLYKHFKEHNQEHVFQYYKDLNDEEQAKLLNQCESIPIKELHVWLKKALADSSSSTTGNNNDDIQPFTGQVISANDESKREHYTKVGMEAIGAGQVCCVVLAGGQGTRLGFDGPKGCYDINLPSHKTLFCLIAERIIRLKTLAKECGTKTDVSIPWYIMTSPMNDEETKQYFETNSFFGLSKSDICFFQQGTLPCLSLKPDEKSGTHRILLESKSSLAMAPDGNGGIYASLMKQGMIKDMEKRGIKYLHVFSIDNAMTKPADPVFIGACIKDEAQCGNKVLWKKRADEKVGVVVQDLNGKACIKEYSDLDDVRREAVDKDGKLLYGAANICNHFFTLDFITGMVLPKFEDMYHIAKKKIPVYEAKSGSIITPESNNGIKLETFIFDVFPLAGKMVLLEVEREEEFAPVKNAPDNPIDSPTSAKIMLADMAKTWLKKAGYTLSGDVDSKECEISPLTSYAGEGLEGLLVGESSNKKDIKCPFQL